MFGIWNKHDNAFMTWKGLAFRSRIKALEIFNQHLGDKTFPCFDDEHYTKTIIQSWLGDMDFKNYEAKPLI